MKKIYVFLLIACAMNMGGQCYGQNLWPQVTKEMKPWTRWWWLGSAVDKENIARELTLLEKSGFGGVEITPIYGAKGFENKYINFLSPKWMDILNATTDKATKLGMGVDMNLGTGWPFGGPQIQEKDAATKLILEEIVLKKGEQLTFPLKPQDAKHKYAALQALRAYAAGNKEINLDVNIDRISGYWTAPEDVRIWALFTARTYQKVKRAAPGGEGYTLDHLGSQSVKNYLNRFDHAFDHKNLKVRAFFNDSYEVYGANWTDTFLLEFDRMKGYKLQDHLLDFAGKGGDVNKTARIKSDYREVVDMLLTKNFLTPFTAFAQQNGALSKNQAHGSPGNLIDLYAATDIAECETFGSSYFQIPGLRRDSADVRNVDPDPMMAKFATSATNVYGKKYTSSETFTWLTEHFKTSLSQTKPEVEQLFLAGVNHIFYHGTTYSPQEVPYPGWLFYASVNFVPHNSFWDHLSGLNQYITRVQSVLQSTKANHELLVYWPVYDLWNDAEKLQHASHSDDGKEVWDKALKVHDVDDWLHPTAFYKESIKLQRRGYSFDFASDHILNQSIIKGNHILTSKEAHPYQAIYIPACHYFSENTMKKILQLAEDGATIIFQAIPKEVPGFSQLEKRTAMLQQYIGSLGFDQENKNQYTAYGKGKIYLTADIHTALETEDIFPERVSQTGLKFTRRISEDQIYYYLVNHGSETVDKTIELNAKSNYYSLLDPQTGKIYALTPTAGKIRVQIQPGYSWIILVSPNQKTDKVYVYMDYLHSEVQLTAPWKVNFIAGGPTLPHSRNVKTLSSWTKWDDQEAVNFSGTAAYETSFSLKKNDGKRYLLKLGRVAESARVFINGQDAGILWSIPFQTNIEQFLVDGENNIRIEVANLMANRMRYLDKNKVSWRNYHEINFVNINYKEFDASDWEPMDSGLMGPVELFSY